MMTCAGRRRKAGWRYSWEAPPRISVSPASTQSPGTAIPTRPAGDSTPGRRWIDCNLFGSSRIKGIAEEYRITLAFYKPGVIFVPDSPAEKSGGSIEVWLRFFGRTNQFRKTLETSRFFNHRNH